MQHKELATGRWNELSLTEQLANIGSEVCRTGKWFQKDDGRFQGAFLRAIELFDLTLSDDRWNYSQLKEIGRVMEVFCDAVYGSEKYNSSFKDLDKYFLLFALKLHTES